MATDMPDEGDGEEDKPKKEGGQDKDALLKEARDGLNAAWEYDKENRDEALKDLKFASGDQWPESVRQERQAANRPCLTLDHISQHLNQVINDIRQAKIQLSAIPVDSGGDDEIAEIYTALMRDIQYQSHAPYVYAHAASGAVKCGIGHFRFETRYLDDAFEQEIIIKAIPYHLAVYWDPASVEPDRSDAMECWVVDFIPTGKFKKLYPKAKRIDIDIPRDNEAGGSNLSWASEDGVLVSEYWRKVPTKRRIVKLTTGEVLDLTDAEDGADAGLDIVQEREIDSFKVEQCLFTGAEILDGPKEWGGHHIPIIAVVGVETHLETKCVREGLIRKARDAQQLYNYWRSAAAEIIALAPKAKWLVTAKQIANRVSQWDNAHSSPKPYLIYEPDQNAASPQPQLVPPPAPPEAIWREAALVVDDMKAATGIYDAALGAKSNETSGVAIARRQSEGDVSTFHFADNLRRSLEHAGRVLIDLIPSIYDTERTVRLMGEDEEHDFKPINVEVMNAGGVPVLFNDLSKGRYDVRVSIGPSYTTQRLEAADSMMEYAKADPQALPFYRDKLVANMDWPGAEEIAERLKKTIPPEVLGDSEKPKDQPQPQQDPNAAAVNELALKQAGAKVAKTEGEARKAHADADQTELENLMEQAQMRALGLQAAPPRPSPIGETPPVQ